MRKLRREDYSHQVRSVRNVRNVRNVRDVRDVVTGILGVKNFDLLTTGLCSGGVLAWE
jgi:hypothetical protein